MENEIKEIIEKNLPAQVGTILKERLEIAESDNKRAKDLERKLNESEDVVKNLNAIIAEYKKYDEQWQSLNRREEEISKKERNAIVTEAELKANEAIKRSDELYNLVQMVFKSPVYKKTIQNDLFNRTNNGYYETTGGTPREITEREE